MAGVGKDGLVLECVSARLMKVRIQLEGQPKSCLFCSVVGYTPTLDAPVRENFHLLERTEQSRLGGSKT